MVDHEALVDRIYEASVIPELWPDILHDVSLLAGCIGGVLFTTAAREVTRWTSSAGTKELFEGFLENRAAQDDNIRLSRSVALRHHGFFGNHQLYDIGEMKKSAVYKDFFLPNGLGYMVGTVLHIPNGDMAVFDLERRLSDGPVSVNEVARLDKLWPHLARSVTLAMRLQLRRARAIVDALEQTGMPAAILDMQGKILAANPSLEAMEKQVAFLAHGRLALVDAASNQLLAQASATARKSVATSSIPIPAREESSAAVIHVLPMTGEASDVLNGAQTLLVVTRMDRTASPSAELLTGLFDLTPSEARVARAIAEGKSTDEIASELGLSRETVRFYLKGIFSKTGVNRQSVLTALLSGSVLPGT